MPGVPRLGDYRATGLQAPYCFHHCRSMASNEARRLEAQLEILTDPDLLSEDREERQEWVERAAVVRRHLLRYRGSGTT